MTPYVHNALTAVKSKRTYFLVQNARMEFDDRPEPAKRLEEARRARGFKSGREAATRFGWKYDSYAQHENGTRGLTRVADRYGQAFGVSPAWLLTGEGMENVTNVPHVSWVSAGRLRASEGVTAADIDKYVRVADLPPGDWIALTVSGDSMDRIAPDDSVIVVNRADDALIDGKFYVFALEGGEATFKMFRRHPEPVMRPYSTNLDHLSTPIETHEVYVFGRVRRVITDV